MFKNILINKMKFIKLTFILVAIIFLYTANSANAKCNFKGLKLGDDISKVDEISDNIVEMKTSVVSFFVEQEIACHDENLGDSIINITFIEDKLASFRISTRLDINNGEIKKKLLYNYVEKEYGKVDPNNDPNWTGFKVWKDGEKTIVYKKMYDASNTFMEEKLFITNKEYREKLIEFRVE